MNHKSRAGKRSSGAFKRLLRPTTDAEAEALVERSDLTQFDLSEMTPTRFEFASKDARVTMRVPGQLLDAIKRAAQRRGVPYQRFIRQALEKALSERR